MLTEHQDAVCACVHQITIHAKRRLAARLHQDASMHAGYGSPVIVSWDIAARHMDSGGGKVDSAGRAVAQLQTRHRLTEVPGRTSAVLCASDRRRAIARGSRSGIRVSSRGSRQQRMVLPAQGVCRG